MSAALSVFKLNVVFKMSTSCSNTRKSSLFWNDRIALSMNSCGKSFHIDSNAVFSSAMFDGFGVNFLQRPSVAP